MALARALAPHPRLMLLDEPFASLDPNLRTQIRADVVELLHETGTAAVFVTHDQAEALAVGDRIAVIRAGQIEQVGTPDDGVPSSRQPLRGGFHGRGHASSSSIATNTTELGTARTYEPAAPGELDRGPTERRDRAPR